jgi:hypothetical protein
VTGRLHNQVVRATPSDPPPGRPSCSPTSRVDHLPAAGRRHRRADRRHNRLLAFGTARLRNRRRLLLRGLRSPTIAICGCRGAAVDRCASVADDVRVRCGWAFTPGRCAGGHRERRHRRGQRRDRVGPRRRSSSTRRVRSSGHRSETASIRDLDPTAEGPSPEHLHQLCIDGLLTTSPPRSLDARPSSLPATKPVSSAARRCSRSSAPRRGHRLGR